MKVLKYILIGLVCLVVVICILGLILPKDFTVARSTVINAPANVVLNNIKNLKNMETWSPWSKRDPNMKIEFGGNDGEVGSWMTWEGNKEVGKGKQEVATITNTSVDTKLTFIEPWESKSDVNFTIADTAGASKVTWTMKGKSPFPFNVFGLFMNMDKMVGDDFNQGLANLKTLSETQAAEKGKTSSNYDIKEINFEPKQYLTKRATVKMADMEQYFGKSIPEVFAAVKKAGLKPAGPVTGIYYTWDKEKQQSDMAVAVPVAGAVPAVKGMEPVKAQGKAVELVLMGGYDQMQSAHDAINKYIAEKNLQYGNMVIEEYPAGPGTEKDTAKWQTNIIYMVK